MIEFSAGGFRDFTRIAASDPVMWRDIFLNNREAVLEMLQRFSEDLTALQRAIRRGEGEKLEDSSPDPRDPPLDHRSEAGLAVALEHENARPTRDRAFSIVKLSCTRVR